MNMFVELKGLRNFLETYPLKPNAQVLWFHLMMIANESGWREELSIPNSVLIARTGISSKNTLISNRNALIQAKRITYRSRGRNKAGIYTIVPFGEGTSPKNEPETLPSFSPESSPSPVNGPEASPRNLSGPKNEPEASLSSSPNSSLETEPETSPYIDKDIDKTGSGGMEGLKQFKSTRELMQAWPVSPDDPIISQLEHYRQQIGESLLEHSVQYMIDRKTKLAGVPKYLEKMVKGWVDKGIKTTEDAEEYEKNYLRKPKLIDSELPDIPIFKLTD